jgi:hypothetical protein
MLIDQFKETIFLSIILLVRGFDWARQFCNLMSSLYLNISIRITYGPIKFINKDYIIFKPNYFKN